MEKDGSRENVSVPAGYHFRPCPRELVRFYLRRRLLNQRLPCQVIKELNIYDFHPKDILGNAPAGKHLYFFTPRKMKYPNGTRPARGTNGGYWKASGKDRIIKDKNKKEIGRKKSLVFHEGHQSNGRRTSWLMQEYTIKEFWFHTDQNKDELGALALCEIYLKPTSNKSKDGELQVDEEEEEDEGPVPHTPDNEDIEESIVANRPVRPGPALCNEGNDRGKALVASTSECPLDSPLALSPITVRPGPPMPLMGYNNFRGHNMVLIPRPSLRPSGLLQPEASYLLNRTRMPMFDSEQPGSLVHPFYYHCVAPASPSSQSGNSNQMMPPPQRMPHGEMSSPESGVAATASSSQHQVPPQRMPPPRFYFEASELVPSTSETSSQTTLWPLPRHLS